MVDARARLEDLHLLDAQDGVEQIDDAGAPGRRLQHLGLAVGQDGESEPPPLEGLEARLHVGERGQGQVGLQQARAPVGREVEAEALRGVDESVLGEPPEIPVPPHEAAQHAVLQLLEPPELGESVALAREELLAERGDREHVEERAVRVECDRLHDVSFLTP